MLDHFRFLLDKLFVGQDAYAECIGIDGVAWVADILRCVPGLTVDPEFCQEDWGVVFFASRGGKKFWVGINWMGDGDWLLHVHHGVFSWIQPWTKSGRSALESLIADLHDTLRTTAGVSSIVLRSASTA